MPTGVNGAMESCLRLLLPSVGCPVEVPWKGWCIGYITEYVGKDCVQDALLSTLGRDGVWDAPLSTLGRDGVLRARWGGGLRAVATGVLQRVPAALLVLQAQPPCEHHGQVAGGGGHLLAMLWGQGLSAPQGNPRAPPPIPTTTTLAAMVAGDIRGLGASSLPMAGYALLAEPISASRRCSTRSFRRCRVLTMGWS